MNNSQFVSPGYFVRQKFLQNKLAMFGLCVIAVAHIIALLGYLIMPDQTPNANDGSALIKKQKAGFEVVVIKFIKGYKVEKVNLLSKIIFGQESESVFLPVDHYSIDGWNLKYQIFGSKEHTVIPLIKVVKPLYAETSNNFMGISQSALHHYFEENCVEKRKYVLGTDKSGRDIFSRLLFGTRISLTIGFIAVVISMLIGIFVGAMSGYYGGIVDRFFMWVMTIVWSVPGIMLVIALTMAMQSKGIWVAFIAVGLTMWVDVARVVRGQVMVLKHKQYVESAIAIGVSNFRIIFVHIIPNIMGSLIVIATANFASAILIEAGLSFLGLGVQSPMPSWGAMVSEGYNSNWETDGGQLLLLPSICITLLVLAFNLFGNGLRDAYDPQTSVKW